jgi:hypothetical protein
MGTSAGWLCCCRMFGCYNLLTLSKTSVLGDGLHLLIQDMNTATSIIRLNGYTFMNMQVCYVDSTPFPFGQFLTFG